MFLCFFPFWIHFVFKNVHVHDDQWDEMCVGWNKKTRKSFSSKKTHTQTHTVTKRVEEPEWMNEQDAYYEYAGQSIHSFSLYWMWCTYVVCQYCVYIERQEFNIGVHGSGSMFFRRSFFFFLSLARSLILSLAMRVLCIVYGSSLICSDYESDAGVYCHCTLFCIYFAIFPLRLPSFSLFTFLFFPFALKFR